jgi:hypothetical protein
MNGSNELGFSRTGGNSGLELRFVGNSTTSKTEDETSDGTMGWDISSMSSINETNELQ